MEEEDTLIPEDAGSEDERIYVTRQEEQIDPDAEADFDREFEKMMAESLDARKFERKAQFDLPLPIRKAQLGHHEVFDDIAGSGSETPPDTMAFSLMTKRGNRPQVSQC